MLRAWTDLCCAVPPWLLRACTVLCCCCAVPPCYVLALYCVCMECVSTARQENRRRVRDMPDSAFCGDFPGSWAGVWLSKSTLLIILVYLTPPKCAGITPNSIRIPCIRAAAVESAARACVCASQTRSAIVCAESGGGLAGVLVAPASSRPMAVMVLKP